MKPPSDNPSQARPNDKDSYPLTDIKDTGGGGGVVVVVVYSALCTDLCKLASEQLRKDACFPVFATVTRELFSLRGHYYDLLTCRLCRLNLF